MPASRLPIVVAESRYIAEDAVDLIFVDYEPLPAIVHLEDALKPDAPIIHDDLGTNLNAHVDPGEGQLRRGGRAG